MRNILILLFIGLVVNCSSSGNISTGSDNTNSEPVTNGVQNPEPVNLNSESGLDLSKYRSTLSDTYSNRKNEIPEAYAQLRKVEENDSERNQYEGYRVQIYSGPEVALADTIASIFRGWSELHIDGYQAETYTFFKAPYYRVHVGDFHEQSKANEFSQLIKRRFRDAWVVYDKVNPWNVPADSVYITFK